MDKKDKVDYWIDIADYDLKTAKSMLDSGRYLYVLFMCQQALEKIIKSLYVNKFDELPLNIKNILEDYLLELSKEIKISSAFIFGSYANNSWDLGSDIDIAIFSPDFAEQDKLDSGFDLEMKEEKIEDINTDKKKTGR